MKKLIVLCLLAFCFSYTKAQGNLQFNQVIFYDIAISGTQNITVPAGKVWKIESVSMGSSGSAPSIFLRNSSVQNIAFFSAPYNSVTASFPFWLPTGFTGSFANNSPSYRCCVSILEFNIIP
jgi:hypothetical protein